MCDCIKDGCQRPEELIGKPEDCTPEQIFKCHGQVQGHPCGQPQSEKEK